MSSNHTTDVAIIGAILRLWNWSRGSAFRAGAPIYDPSIRYASYRYPPPRSRRPADLRAWRERIADSLPSLR